jgi:hypothetical protein
MRTVSAVLALLSICPFVGTPASAQRDEPSETKDPQSKFEPRSKPGEGQKFLRRFVGEWDVVKTFHPRTGDPVRQKGECRQAMIHDGRFLRSEFTFRRGEEKSTGTGLLGFEAETGLFTSVWTDSRSTRMSFRQAREKFDGKQIVLHGRSLGDAGKAGRSSRTVTTMDDAGGRIVHRQYTSSEGGKERLVMELLMTKKKGSSAGK